MLLEYTNIQIWNYMIMEIWTLFRITISSMVHFIFGHIKYNICVRKELWQYFMFFIVKTCKNFLLLSTLKETRNLFSNGTLSWSFIWYIYASCEKFLKCFISKIYCTSLVKSVLFVMACKNPSWYYHNVLVLLRYDLLRLRCILLTQLQSLCVYQWALNYMRHSFTLTFCFI